MPLEAIYAIIVVSGCIGALVGFGFAEIQRLEREARRYGNAREHSSPRPTEEASPGGPVK